MNLLTFEEALERANSIRTSRGSHVKKHVLLGNGFSIALRPDIFSYSSLFEKTKPGMPEQLVKIFEQLKTTDFEEVIQGLESAASILPFYSDNGSELSDAMTKDAMRLKESLVTVIAQNHPPRPGDISESQYTACKEFLSHFVGSGGDILSLNYDILLYWVLMHTDLSSDDGFRTDPEDPDAEYVYWADDDSHSQRIHFLHGALHLFDAGYQLRKYTWNRTDIPLVDQARIAVAGGDFPLFVSEGDSKKKLNKIRHSGYLSRCYKRLSDIGGCLFTLGWSLADNDQHIIQKISRGKINHLFVGIHGDPDSERNQPTINTALMLAGRGKYNNLSVDLFDSATAKVWG